MSLGEFVHDTIAALATPPGLSALAIVRISGPDSYAIVSSLSRGRIFKARYATHCRLYSNDDSSILDDVVVTWFKAPDSYTGDDIIEISCHGGHYSAQSILNNILARGARMALAGEFTQRAFLNGKLDLLQVEAVADIIHGQSQKQQLMAQRTLKGELSQELHKIKKELLRAAALIELELDFSDQEIEKTPISELLDLISSAESSLSDLLGGYSSGRIQREGLNLALLGRPNVGKSTLLNLLLRTDRTITSEIPGTTRDTIEEQFSHEGQLFNIVDTAGIRDSLDSIEKEGMKRSYLALEAADLLLLLVDSSTNHSLDLEKELLQKYDKPSCVILTKIDLTEDEAQIKTLQDSFSHETVIPVNLKNAEQRDPLLNRIYELANKHFSLYQESHGLSRLRHFEHIQSCLHDLKQGREALENGMGTEVLSIDLRSAISQLDSLTGETRSEDILNHIFADFCIGK